MKNKVISIILSSAMVTAIIPMVSFASENTHETSTMVGNYSESYDGESGLLSFEENYSSDLASDEITIKHNNTIEDIVEAAKQYPSDAIYNRKEPVFKESPSYKSPYKAGKLSDDDVQESLNAIKMFRMIAGVPYENIYIDDEQEYTAQCKAVLMAVSEYGHNPPKPDDMSDEFYNAANSFTAECVAWGFTSMAGTIHRWIEDTGLNNVDHVGHRQILLEPSAVGFGFGYADSGKSGKLFAAHRVREYVDADTYVAWPNSGDFPIEYFNSDWAYSAGWISPWSLSLGDAYADINENSVVLTLTRERDNKKWVFDKNTNRITTDEEYYSDNYMHFNVDKEFNYNRCIVFRPDLKTLGEIKPGDKFNIDVTGISYKDGTPAEIKYNINFFKLTDEIDKSTVNFNVKHIGENISDAIIKIDGKTVVTDNNGDASIRLNNNKTYNYTVEKEGYNTIEGTVKVGEEKLSESVNLTKNVVFTIKDTEKTYNGENQGVTVEANPQVEYIVKYDGSTDIPKDAGTYVVSVETNKEGYSGSENSVLKIAKANLTVTADNISKRIGSDDPELTYTITEGKLFNGDSLEGNLQRKTGEKLGKYDILQGSLKAGNNYNMTYNKGVFEILDKYPQNITVSEFSEKVYGDESFKIDVKPDSTSNLTGFTFESDNTAAAEVSADGTVTIKGVGEANITVKEAGNEDYAAFSKTQKLTISPKPIKISKIDLDARTAELSGVLKEDEDVSLDFSQLKLDVTESGEDECKVTVSNFVLAGEDSKNYTAADEKLESVVKTENIASVKVNVSNGTEEGSGTYLKGSSVTVTAKANSGYTFAGWYSGTEKVSGSAAYTFELKEDTELEARMNRRSSGGGGGGGGSAAGSTAYTVKFNTNGGSEISGTEVKSGAKAEKPENPKRKGYIFAGWYTDEDCTKEYSFNEPVKASVTLYAKWNEAKITMRIGSKEAEVFGEKKTNDVAPIIVNDRTMLPARFVAENLGAEVEWDDNNRQVIITRDDIKIVLTIDSAAAVVNGEEKELDSPAFIENDRTYTPVRFIAENLGADVEWDEGESLVTITKAD